MGGRADELKQGEAGHGREDLNKITASAQPFVTGQGYTSTSNRLRVQDRGHRPGMPMEFLAMPVAVHVEEARELFEEKNAVLVCAYDDDGKCRKLGVEGSIPMSEFRSKVDRLPKTQPIVFVCG